MVHQGQNSRSARAKKSYSKKDFLEKVGRTKYKCIVPQKVNSHFTFEEEKVNSHFTKSKATVYQKETHTLPKVNSQFTRTEKEKLKPKRKTKKENSLINGGGGLVNVSSRGETLGAAAADFDFDFLSEKDRCYLPAIQTWLGKYPHSSPQPLPR